MKEQELLQRVLRDSGYSTTKVRIHIFNLLLGVEPQTMRRLIQSAESAVDRVSVYRTIELYEKLGIVDRIKIGWKYKLELSDVFLDHHHHMTCMKCGRIIAIRDEPIFENTIKKLSEKNNFVLTHHQLEMQGYCERCQ